ncbi:PAS domain-containing protein [Roseivivax sediminis]|uniref:PAS domain-containing protein n=1 Tax=Roseivivax sediminis TaxID=936889 RepID=A0A1I1WVB8_9RHOB|nr:PAS domain-containing protein [Roseivivax sediminis]SFD98992.1 PAS domain-containing protein [Roseivivax sediminis]
MFDRSKFPSRVVSMTDHERARRLRPLRLIETYWQELADETGDVPHRDSVDPRGIQDALEFAFLAERIAPRIARLRVAGAHLSDLMGMEVAGLPLSAFIMPDSRGAIGTGIERMFSGEGALHAEFRATQGLGRPDLRAHLLILPLRSEAGAVDRALGALVTIGQIGRVPRRFDLSDLHLAPLAISAAPANAPAPDEAGMPGFAEPRIPFEAAQHVRRAEDADKTRKPYLRLVVSND